MRKLMPNLSRENQRYATSLLGANECTTRQHPRRDGCDARDTNRKRIKGAGDLIMMGLDP